MSSSSSCASPSASDGKEELNLSSPSPVVQKHAAGLATVSAFWNKTRTPLGELSKFDSSQLRADFQRALARIKFLRSCGDDLDDAALGFVQNRVPDYLGRPHPSLLNPLQWLVRQYQPANEDAEEELRTALAARLAFLAQRDGEVCDPDLPLAELCAAYDAAVWPALETILKADMQHALSMCSHHAQQEMLRPRGFKQNEDLPEDVVQARAQAHRSRKTDCTLPLLVAVTVCAVGYASLPLGAVYASFAVLGWHLSRSPDAIPQVATVVNKVREVRASAANVLSAGTGIINRAVTRTVASTVTSHAGKALTLLAGAACLAAACVAYIKRQEATRRVKMNTELESVAALVAQVGRDIRTQSRSSELSFMYGFIAFVCALFSLLGGNGVRAHSRISQVVGLISMASMFSLAIARAANDAPFDNLRNAANNQERVRELVDLDDDGLAQDLDDADAPVDGEEETMLQIIRRHLRNHGSKLALAAIVSGLFIAAWKMRKTQRKLESQNATIGVLYQSPTENYAWRAIAITKDGDGMYATEIELDLDDPASWPAQLIALQNVKDPPIPRQLLQAGSPLKRILQAGAKPSLLESGFQRQRKRLAIRTDRKGRWIAYDEDGYEYTGRLHDHDLYFEGYDDMKEFELEKGWDKRERKDQFIIDAEEYYNIIRAADERAAHYNDTRGYGPIFDLTESVVASTAEHLPREGRKPVCADPNCYTARSQAGHSSHFHPYQLIKQRKAAADKKLATCANTGCDKKCGKRHPTPAPKVRAQPQKSAKPETRLAVAPTSLDKVAASVARVQVDLGTEKQECFALFVRDGYAVTVKHVFVPKHHHTTTAVIAGTVAPDLSHIKSINVFPCTGDGKSTELVEVTRDDLIFAPNADLVFFRCKGLSVPAVGKVSDHTAVTIYNPISRTVASGKITQSVGNNLRYTASTALGHCGLPVMSGEKVVAMHRLGNATYNEGVAMPAIAEALDACLKAAGRMKQ